MTTKDFDIGDLVWAKMKGFPFWPGKIMDPPTNAKFTPKKSRHYVFFFGSANFAWIQNENIVHHSEEMLQSTSVKKKSTLLKVALEHMTEALKHSKSLVKGKEFPEMSSEVSTSDTEKKIAKVERRKKGKSGRQNVRKKVVPKRRAMDESEYQITASPLKLPETPTENLSGVINNTPPNFIYKSTTVVRPVEESPPSPPTLNSLAFVEITRRGQFESQPVPILDLLEPNEVITKKNIQPSHEKIGFIGLGTMGQRFVKNLLTSKHKVTIWNRTHEKCKDFADIGADIADSPSDVVQKCDIIICCVSDSMASKCLVFGRSGILSGLQMSPPGSKSYVEMTTLDPDTSRDIAEAINRCGGRYLEAPFSWSRKGAEDGDLLILGAGDKEVYFACESCFFTLSNNAYFINPEVGTASKMNLIVNTLMGVSSGALAEAMQLVELCNLDQTDFINILELLTASTRFLIEKAEAMKARSSETNTSLKYVQRQMSLALSVAHDCVQPMSVTSAANEVFKRARSQNFSDHDISAVYMGAEY